MIRVGRWWALLWVAWMLLAGTWSVWIVVLGGILALPPAILGMAIGEYVILDARPRLRWTSSLRPDSVFRGFCSVSVELVRAVGTGRHAVGQFRTEKASGQGTPGRRAWLELSESWAPSTYVIDIGPDSGERLTHVVHVPRRRR